MPGCNLEEGAKPRFSSCLPVRGVHEAAAIEEATLDEEHRIHDGHGDQLLDGERYGELVLFLLDYERHSC